MKELKSYLISTSLHQRLNIVERISNPYNYIFQNSSTLIILFILLLQKKYGSLFFLPSWLRAMKYDRMVRSIREMSTEEIEKPWQLWLNPLRQVELYYSNNWTKITKSSNTLEFYETKWGHVYHQNCLLMSLEIFSNCPHWSSKIPKNGFDD